MVDLLPLFAFAVGTATMGLSCALLLRRAGRPAAALAAILAALALTGHSEK